MANPLEEGAIVEITFMGRCADQRILNVVHYQVGPFAGEPFPNQRHAVDKFMEDWIEGSELAPGVLVAFLACLPPNYTLETIRGQTIYPTRYAYVSRVEGIDGTRTEDAVATQVCAALTKQADGVGAGQHGEVFVGPLSAEDMVNGRLSTSFADGPMSTLGEKLAEVYLLTVDASSAELRPVIYRRATPAASPYWTHSTVQPTVRTLHRRTVGVGE